MVLFNSKREVDRVSFIAEDKIKILGSLMSVPRDLSGGEFTSAGVSTWPAEVSTSSNVRLRTPFSLRSFGIIHLSFWLTIRKVLIQRDGRVLPVISQGRNRRNGKDLSRYKIRYLAYQQTPITRCSL